MPACCAQCKFTFNMHVQQALQQSLMHMNAIDNALNTFRLLVSRAHSAAVSAAHVRDIALRGSRIERSEQLLQKAHEQFMLVTSEAKALRELLTCVDAGGKQIIMWNTPPLAWWMHRKNALQKCMQIVCDAFDEVHRAWNCALAESDYTSAVKRIVHAVNDASSHWNKLQLQCAEWKDVVAAIGDGLPSSHSITVTRN